MNTRLFFRFVLLLGLLAIFTGIICNKTFLEWTVSHDGEIVDPKYLGYIFLFRLACVSMGFLLLIVFFVRNILMKDWRDSLAKYRESRGRNISLQELLPHPSNKIAFISLTILAIWAGLVLYGSLFNKTWLTDITKENGITENLTVLLYFIAAGMAIRKIKGGAERWWLIFIAFFFIIIALEEINWGQTFLKFNTTDTFHALNYQNDVSLHNIELFSKQYWANNAMHWLAALVGIITPVLLWLSLFLRRIFYAFRIPLPSYAAQCGFILSVLIPGDDFLWNLFKRTNTLSELKELTLAMSFFLLIWHLAYKRHK